MPPPQKEGNNLQKLQKETFAPEEVGMGPGTASNNTSLVLRSSTPACGQEPAFQHHCLAFNVGGSGGVSGVSDHATLAAVEAPVVPGGRPNMGSVIIDTDPQHCVMDMMLGGLGARSWL